MPNLRVRAGFTGPVSVMTVTVAVRQPKPGPGKKPYGRVKQVATDTTISGGFFQVDIPDIPTPTPPKKLVIRIAGMNADKKVIALHTKKL
jgi:hypothetical protein